MLERTGGSPKSELGQESDDFTFSVFVPSSFLYGRRKRKGVSRSRSAFSLNVFTTLFFLSFFVLYLRRLLCDFERLTMSSLRGTCTERQRRPTRDCTGQHLNRVNRLFSFLAFGYCLPSGGGRTQRPRTTDSCKSFHVVCSPRS